MNAPNFNFEHTADNDNRDEEFDYFSYPQMANDTLELSEILPIRRTIGGIDVNIIETEQVHPMHHQIKIFHRKTGEFIGSVCFEENDRRGEIRLSLIATAEKYRRLGLATFMIQLVVEYALQKGFDVLSDPVETSTKLFYELGFRADPKHYERIGESPEKIDEAVQRVITNPRFRYHLFNFADEGIMGQVFVSLPPSGREWWRQRIAETSSILPWMGY
jgi:GNAT superfamily N-acetyltransferase